MISNKELLASIYGQGHSAKDFQPYGPLKTASQKGWSLHKQEKMSWAIFAKIGKCLPMPAHTTKTSCWNGSFPHAIYCSTSVYKATVFLSCVPLFQTELFRRHHPFREKVEISKTEWGIQKRKVKTPANLSSFVVVWDLTLVLARLRRGWQIIQHGRGFHVLRQLGPLVL